MSLFVNFKTISCYFNFTKLKSETSASLDIFPAACFRLLFNQKQFSFSKFLSFLSVNNTQSHIKFVKE